MQESIKVIKDPDLSQDCTTDVMADMVTDRQKLRSSSLRLKHDCDIETTLQKKQNNNRLSAALIQDHSVGKTVLSIQSRYYVGYQSDSFMDEAHDGWRVRNVYSSPSISPASSTSCATHIPYRSYMGNYVYVIDIKTT